MLLTIRFIAFSNTGIINFSLDFKLTGYYRQYFVDIAYVKSKTAPECRRFRINFPGYFFVLPLNSLLIMGIIGFFFIFFPVGLITSCLLISITCGTVLKRARCSEQCFSNAFLIFFRFNVSTCYHSGLKSFTK